MKNILFISKYAVVPKFGNPMRQYYLAKYFVKKGFNVTLVSSQSSAILKYQKLSKFFHHEKIDGIDYFLMRGPKISLGFSIKRIISWLIFELNVLKLTRKKIINKPDIILVSSLSLLTFLTGVYLKKKYNAKLILEVRDIWPLSLVEVGGFSRFNPIILLLKFVERYGYKNADKIVGTMPNLKENVLNVIPDYNQAKVKFVPQGYDEEISEIHNFSEQFVKNQERIDKNNFNIIYAGTIGKANRIDLLIESCKLIGDNNEIHFYVMGDGPLKQKYVSECVGLNNIDFLPALPSQEVFHFLKMFNLLIFQVDQSTIYRFGISFNKSIDYMRSGVPFLYSYDGYPSLINEEKYSFRVKSDANEIVSAIKRISQMDVKVLQEMGLQGQKVAQNFHTFDVLSDNYIEIFKSF